MPEKKTSKKRLFVGTFLDAPEMEVLGELKHYDERLAVEWNAKLRWVRPEKLHLTWVFLGDVHEERIPEIEAALAQTVRDVPHLELMYAKPTFWPDRKRARTFVLTPEPAPEAVMVLGERIKKAMKPYAEKIEPKYRPHITVLRMERHGERHGALDLPEWFPLKHKLPIVHHINRIDLIESHVGGAGDYQSIAHWRLIN